MRRGRSQSWASSDGVRRSMQSNRSADTRLEIMLRSALHRKGLRFRKGLSIETDLGRVKPDVVFTKARVAVFCDGCFWHRCPIHATDPKKNSDYWMPKLLANVERDRAVDRALEAGGWIVVRMWEHEVREDVVEAVSRIATVVREPSPSVGSVP